MEVGSTETDKVSARAGQDCIGGDGIQGPSVVIAGGVNQDTDAVSDGAGVDVEEPFTTGVYEITG